MSADISALERPLYGRIAIESRPRASQPLGILIDLQLRAIGNQQQGFDSETQRLFFFDELIQGDSQNQLGLVGVMVDLSGDPNQEFAVEKRP